MLSQRESPLTHFIRVLLIITFLALSFPKPISAAPLNAITVKFEIASVKIDESVTIRTIDFPVRTNFTVFMGKATNRAVDGEKSIEFNSGSGGKLDITLPIPETMKGTRIVGIRIESKDGYAGYNWFFNRTQTALIPDSSLKPDLIFSNVKKNSSVTVEATNLPSNTVFRVRVGPHYTFYQNYVSVNSVTTDNIGSAKFNIDLGPNIKDAEFISVRMDGGSRYVYSTFKNMDGGNKATASELVKIVPCTLLYINPIPALAPREDFDVVWTIQNTGLEKWDQRRFLFKYREGEEFHKYDGKVFLNYTIERGWTYDLAVDMLAPESAGWHTTTWALVNRFDETICKFKVNIFVHD